MRERIILRKHRGPHFLSTKMRKLRTKLIRSIRLLKIFVCRPYFEDSAGSATDRHGGRNMKAVSHIAIGVRDMEKSLHFYRDLLGLKVTLDAMENVGGRMGRIFANAEMSKRRAVYL